MIVLCVLVSSKDDCPLSKLGAERLSALATEFEISLPVTYVPSYATMKHLPDYYQRSSRWQAIFGNPKSARGNFIDMFIRRSRAYELAQDFAIRKDFEWDLIVFTRLDSAFYEPKINIHQLYTDIYNFNKVYGVKGIYIPASCNFAGVCDRFAAGMREQMDVYFDYDMPLKVLQWTVLPTNETRDAKYLDFMADDFFPRDIDNISCIRDEMRIDGPSEHLMELWFIMNNLTQIDFKDPVALVFATLRSQHADAYCSKSKRDFAVRYPNQTCIHPDPDKRDLLVPYNCTPSVLSARNKLVCEDQIGDSDLRCGIHVRHLNASQICKAFPGSYCDQDPFFVYGPWKPFYAAGPRNENEGVKPLGNILTLSHLKLHPPRTRRLHTVLLLCGEPADLPHTLLHRAAFFSNCFLDFRI